MKRGDRVRYSPHGNTQQSREWVDKIATVVVVDRHNAYPNLTPVEFDHRPHEVLYVPTGELSVLL